MTDGCRPPLPASKHAGAPRALLRELHCPARLHSGQKSSSCRWPSELLSHPAGLGSLSTTRHLQTVRQRAWPPALKGLNVTKGAERAPLQEQLRSMAAPNRGRPTSSRTRLSQSMSLGGRSTADLGALLPNHQTAVQRAKHHLTVLAASVCEPAPRSCSVGLV